MRPGGGNSTPRRVEVVGDFAPRSISEIVEGETPLFVASARSVSPMVSRRAFKARPTFAAVLSAIVDILSSIAYDSSTIAEISGQNAHHCLTFAGYMERPMNRVEFEAELRGDGYEVSE